MDDPTARAPYAGATSSAVASTTESGWAILLASSAPTRAVASEQELSRYQTMLGTGDVRAVTLRSGRAIVTGSFASSTEPQAQAELERIKAVRVDGKRPFQGAILVPLTSPDLAPAAASPESGLHRGPEPLDLRQVRARLGPDAIYSLQIAFFGVVEEREASEAELVPARRQAEALAESLRAQGERAFFIHTPRGAAVTVGVFGHSDIEASAQSGRTVAFSPRLRAAQAKHPHNMVNGKVLMVPVRTSRGTQERAQESQLVRIP